MGGYGQYCPLAKGAEVFAERWTPLILRELLRGSQSFNEIHRGVPRMSRTLLSNRLRKLELCGVIRRGVSAAGGKGARAYCLTPAGQELGVVITQLGTWAQRWFRTTFDKHELDPGVLMWDIRCTLDPRAFSSMHIALQFVFEDVPRNARNWWLVYQHDELDLCPVDPGIEVGLVIRTRLVTLTRIWMGEIPLRDASREGQISILGACRLRTTFEKCFRLSPYSCIADARKERAA
jgi:DNA-binding HxlR family transcriptional regulator